MKGRSGQGRADRNMEAFIRISVLEDKRGEETTAKNQQTASLIEECGRSRVREN